MKRIVAALVLAVILTGCATHSGRVTVADANNWDAEQMTAYRDEARVIYDRGGSELSEGHVLGSTNVVAATGGNMVTDWITALVGVLPDLKIRVQVLKVEWDVVAPEDDANADSE